MLQKLTQRRREDEGFTLIELMVVVLIMGILMAIAIPTFLSTRNAAYDSAAKSNATNAFTSEKAYYQDDQVFLDASSSTNAKQLDNSLPWTGAATATVGTVTALAFNGTSEATSSPYTGTILVIEADASHSQDCFYIFDSEPTTGSPNIGYAETTGGCNGTTALGLSAFPGATVSTSTTAGQNTVAEGTALTTWYSSW